MILLALSVCALRSLVNVYMTELQFLDMAVNTKNLQVCVLALGIQDPVEMLLGESPVIGQSQMLRLGVTGTVRSEFARCSYGRRRIARSP